MTNIDKTRRKPLTLKKLFLQQFKPSRITYNAYNASNNAATTHLEGVSHKQQADARPILIRTGSKTSNASSNSHLTDHNNSSLRGSLRSIASNPVTNGNETGPLRVQYRMGSSLRSKCSVISDTKSEFDDNYIYSSHITDTNQNINEFSVSISFLPIFSIYDT